MKTVQTICRHCGKELRVPIELTGDAELDTITRRMARDVVHDQCARSARQGVQRMEEASLMQLRAARWETLVDPFYADSLEWWQSNASRGVLNDAKVQEALDTPTEDRGLLLYGAITGRGKTTAAWLVLRREHLKGKLCCKVTHVEIAQKAVALACQTSPQLTRWLSLIHKCDILFLDDLGKAKSVTVTGTGKAHEELLYDLLDARKAHNRPVVLTANYAREHLEGMWSTERGEYIMRRLREMCRGINFDT